ncbi:MAG: DUF3604 domain-containing protein [Bauldia sp.]|nr:DUF3604 domain-containing protein [Bauldia sp.]
MDRDAAGEQAEPRAGTYDRVNFGLDLPDTIPLEGQERAYTSPIWYAAGG